MAMPRDRTSALAAVICVFPARKPAYTNADCHSLRNVMQGHRQHHHGGAPELAFRTLGLFTSHMKMGNQTVKQEQKQHAAPKADKGGEKGQLPHILRLLNGGDQQAPDGRCHHHAGGKARKGALHQITKGSFHKKHAGRAQRCTQERDHDSKKSFHLSHRLCIAVLFVSSESRLVPVFGMFL